MRTCAVIIAAWRAERWIAECLASIERQREAKGWAVTIRIAVDACRPTAQELERLKVPYWWSPENVGPYLLRNSLIEQEEADAYAIFDADDIMEPRYLERLLRMSGRKHIAGAARMTINEKGRIRSRRSPYAHGVSVIGHEAWRTVGGYRPWRIAADSDLTARAKELGVRIRSTSRALYRRRRHEWSLTRRPETRLRSDAREAVRAESAARIKAGELYVPPETVELEWRGT